MRRQIIVSLLPLVLACCSSDQGNPLAPKPTALTVAGPNGSAQASPGLPPDWAASTVEWRCMITTSPPEKRLGQAKSAPACAPRAARASRLGESSLVGIAAATAPTNLTFSVSGDSTVTLTWTAAAALRKAIGLVERHHDGGRRLDGTRAASPAATIIDLHHSGAVT